MTSPLLPLTGLEEQDDPALTHDPLQEVILYYSKAVDTFPLQFGNLRQAQQGDDNIQEEDQK